MSFYVNGSMICPPTKYLKCDDNIDNLMLTGIPTVFNNHSHLVPKYIDQANTNACNIGHVIRRWYLDYNNNNAPDPGEATCYQDIYISGYPQQPVIITYPADITVSCLGDVPSTHPSIVSGSCDLIGINTEDKEFIIQGSSEDGCRKILRKFTIINWCNSSQIWTGTQVIKIIDKEKPEILSCGDVVIGFNQGCKAKVELTNKAKDNGSCASNQLQWFVDVDLHADGKYDLFYSNTAIGDFFIPFKNNNEEIKIRFPGLYGNGIHKVLWKVKDSCGNITSCESVVITKDTKAPTPYCFSNASVAIPTDGSSINMAARMFNHGAYDNCTDGKYIKFSFTPNTKDSLMKLDCSSVGYKVLDIYATDLAGNSSRCKVSFTTFDNGGCNSNITFAGKVLTTTGKQLKEGKVRLEAHDGLYNLSQIIKI